MRTQPGSSGSKRALRHRHQPRPVLLNVAVATDYIFEVDGVVSCLTDDADRTKDPAS